MAAIARASADGGSSSRFQQQLAEALHTDEPVRRDKDRRAELGDDERSAARTVARQRRALAAMGSPPRAVPVHAVQRLWHAPRVTVGASPCPSSGVRLGSEGGSAR